VLLPAELPIDSAIALGCTSADTWCARLSAIDAARHRAQSSESARGPPTASPNVRHRGNPSCARVARGSTAPAQDVVFPSSRVPLPASGRSVYSAAPGFPRRVSRLLLPRPVAQPATPPVSAEPLASCQNTPREMVLPIDFNVRDNYVQHSLMHIDPRHTGTVPHNRAHGAAAQNRSPLIKWAAKQENVQPLEMCFFLTPAFIELYRLRVNRDLGGKSLP
jgi:hypothetical protein